MTDQKQMLCSYKIPTLKNLIGFLKGLLLMQHAAALGTSISPPNILDDKIEATEKFINNYQDMRDANTIGADKYFHCKANCEAAQVSNIGSGVAKTISDTREWVDQNIKGDPEVASQQDQVRPTITVVSKVQITLTYRVIRIFANLSVLTV